MMLSSRILLRKVPARSLSTAVGKTAMDAYRASCYLDRNFCIPEQETVQKAVETFTAYDAGALVTVNDKGQLSGIVSERDVLKKVALLDAPTTAVLVKEIYTAKPVTVNPEDSVEECMTIMMDRDIRHLPVVDSEGVVVGLISIKDCVKMVLKHQEETIQVLKDFAMGKSGTFVVD